MSKRIRKVVDDLPFDCWTHIILFYDSSEDLIVIFLVVKGLFEYVKGQCPRCSKNVVFKVKHLPTRKVRNAAIQNVDFKREKSELTNRFDKSGRWNVKTVLERLLVFFPFISVLKAEFVEATNYRAFHTKLVLDRVDFVHDSLHEMYLTVCSSLSLSQKFPNLRRLYLRRDYSEDEDEEVDEGDHDDGKNDRLFVEWSFLPALEYLYLYDWKLEDNCSIINLKDRLIRLDFENFDADYVFPLQSFKGFKELRSINLSLSKIKFHSIENIPNLERLHISGVGESLALNAVRNLPKLNDLILPIDMDVGRIENLPCLHTLYVGSKKIGNIAKLQNLVKLNIHLANSEDAAVICEFPSLMEIYICSYSSVNEDSVLRVEMFNLPLLKRLRFIGRKNSSLKLGKGMSNLVTLRWIGSNLEGLVVRDDILARIRYLHLLPAYQGVLESPDLFLGKLFGIITQLENIVSLLLKFHSVQSSHREELRSVLSKKGMCFNNLSSIGEIRTDGYVRTKKIENCSKLKRIRVLPSFDVKLSGLPSLHKADFLGEIGDIEITLLFDSIAELPSLKILSFTCTKKQELDLNKIHLGMLNSLSISNCSRISIDGSGSNDLKTLKVNVGGSVVIMNLAVLESLQVNIVEPELDYSNTRPKRRIVLKKCDRLKNVRMEIGSDFKTSQRRAPPNTDEFPLELWLGLFDLPSLEQLKIRGYRNFHRIDKENLPKLKYTSHQQKGNADGSIRSDFIASSTPLINEGTKEKRVYSGRNVDGFE